MVRKIYNKLVRDAIPKIIQTEGQRAKIRVAIDDEEFELLLCKKLVEEANEFLATHELEELADILEIIITFLDLKGKTMADLEAIRHKKRQERGGFEKRTVLKSVES